MKTRFFLLIAASLVSACTFEGLRSPGPSDQFAWTNRNGATSDQVKIELMQCGDGFLPSNMKPRLGESADNARARQYECMFAKGFYIKSGSGGTCSDPEYRAELPACMHAPVRPREGYYGQALSPKAQERLELEMTTKVAAYRAREANSATLRVSWNVRFSNPKKFTKGQSLQDAGQCTAVYTNAQKQALGSEIENDIKAFDCMLKKGYAFENEKYICDRPGWREGISACAAYAKAFADDQLRVYETVKTESWPYVQYEFMNPERKVMSIFRQEQLGCWMGKGSNSNQDWTNLRIQSIECMLDKGYVLSESETQRLCRNVDYKNKLSSCLGVRK